MSLFPLLRNSVTRWKSTGEILNHGARGKLLLNLAPIECRKCFSNSLFLVKPDPKHGRTGRKTFLVLGFVIAGSYFLVKKRTALAEKAEPIEPGKFIKDLPVFTESDLAKHKTSDTGIWVTYKNGVYDVTEFVNMHPGGNKILLAAGSSVEPYWALYKVHHTQDVYRLLEEYRIGNIEVDLKETVEKATDHFVNEPKRHPALRHRSLAPYNAEPPASLLVDNFYTPNCMFFVRNHLPVPAVDVKEYRLQISGIGVKSTSLTLEEIKKFPKHTVSATIQCAGNRRSEMTRVKEVKGLRWEHAAIGNASWSGARLTDVLKSCGLDLERTDVEHVQFEGLDTGADGAVYGASVPSEKALDPKADVILAYEMNGKPLPRDHGFPLRVVVPGIVGARNVKWVSKVILSDKESNSHWQQFDYKGFSPSTTWDNVDYSISPAIQEFPVTSAICIPEDGEEIEIHNGGILCKGYAWSGGGRKIIRVDVSADKGKTWHVANMEQLEDKSPRHWAWTLWSINVPVPNEDTVEIWAKAVDSAYNTQPENFDYIWNLRGVLSHAYHKIKIEKKKTQPAEEDCSANALPCLSHHSAISDYIVMTTGGGGGSSGYGGGILENQTTTKKQRNEEEKKEALPGVPVGPC